MFCNRCGAKINDGVSFCPKCGTPTYNQLEQHRAAVQANPTSRPAATSFPQSVQNSGEVRKEISLLESQIENNEKIRNKAIFSIIWLVCLLLFFQSDFYIELVFSLFGSSISNDSTILYAFATVLEWFHEYFTIVLIVFIILIVLDIVKIVSFSADTQACRNEIAALRRMPQESEAPADSWQCSCGRKNANYITSCVCGKSKRDAIKY